MWKQGGALLRKKASVLVPPPHEGDGKPKGTASSSSSSLDKYGSSDNKEDDGIPAYVKSKAHHAGQGYYVNPWPSAQASSWVPTFQIPIAWSEEAHPSIKRRRGAPSRNALPEQKLNCAARHTHCCRHPERKAGLRPRGSSARDQGDLAGTCCGSFARRDLLQPLMKS